MRGREISRNIAIFKIHLETSVAQNTTRPEDFATKMRISKKCQQTYSQINQLKHAIALCVQMSLSTWSQFSILKLLWKY